MRRALGISCTPCVVEPSAGLCELIRPHLMALGFHREQFQSTLSAFSLSFSPYPAPFVGPWTIESAERVDDLCSGPLLVVASVLRLRGFDVMASGLVRTLRGAWAGVAVIGGVSGSMPQTTPPLLA